MKALALSYVHYIWNGQFITHPTLVISVDYKNHWKVWWETLEPLRKTHVHIITRCLFLPSITFMTCIGHFLAHTQSHIRTLWRKLRSYPVTHSARSDHSRPDGAWHRGCVYPCSGQSGDWLSKGYALNVQVFFFPLFFLEMLLLTFLLHLILV